jgi:hypothetical protein
MRRGSNKTVVQKFGQQFVIGLQLKKKIKYWKLTGAALPFGLAAAEKKKFKKNGSAARTFVRTNFVRLTFPALL